LDIDTKGIHTSVALKAGPRVGPGLTQTKSELGTEDKPWRFATGIGEGMAISNNLEKDRAAVEFAPNL
jgi:hypothetical protein